MKKLILTLFVALLSAGIKASAGLDAPADTPAYAPFDTNYTVARIVEPALYEIPVAQSTAPAIPLSPALEPIKNGHGWVSPYALPYTPHSTGANWHRMWINTAVLSGAFIGTLFVLELLPEDATAWNRAAISQVPMFKRWFRNIFKKGPEWDHDNPIFNYVLHPYAGAAYFMSARSCGFSFWGSMLYSAAISTVGWEFGIEAFMERPSYQDIVVTPVVGSLLGELMYKGKRAIVDRGYELLGSPVLGHAACFLLDPVNEVIDLFRGNPCSKIARANKVRSTFAPSPSGFALSIYF